MPATHPSGAPRPRRRRRGRVRRTAARPRPLQVNTSAPSADRRRRLGEQGAQVLVGGVGVAHLELHGRAHRHASVATSAPASRSAPTHVPDEEVAPAERGAVLVDGDAEVQALGHPGALVGVGRADQRLEPVEGGAAGQLEEAVAVGRRHDHRLADGPAALRHDERGGHGRRAGRRRPPRRSCTSPSRTRRLPPGPGPRTPARRRRPRAGRAGRASPPRRRPAARTGRRAARAPRRGRSVSAERPPSATPDGVRAAVTRTGRGGAASRPAHRATAGASSTSRSPPTTATPVAPISTVGASRARTAPAISSTRRRGAASRTGPRGRRPVPICSSRRPTTSPVASAGSGCIDRALANGTATSGQPAGGPGTSVYGTTVVCPWSTRQWASTVP